MTNPAGESNGGALRLDFDRRLMLQFRGSVVTSDARVCSPIANSTVSDCRRLAAIGSGRPAHGQNGRHAFVGMLRRSVFGRLAGYEDVNDADRLRHDPTMRWIVGVKRGWTGRCSLAEPNGPFRDPWLTAADKNLSALADLSGQWIDRVHGRRPPRGVVLDMDSSVSPTSRRTREWRLERPLYLHLLPFTVRVKPIR